MNNSAAFRMLESRFSDQIKSFNSRLDVTEADSDTHYWAVLDRIELARVALDRAPAFRVTTLARSLGDVYRAVRQNLTPDELVEWEILEGTLESLMDKYDC